MESSSTPTSKRADTRPRRALAQGDPLSELPVERPSTYEANVVAYSAEEEAQIEESLRNLGYL